MASLIFFLSLQHNSIIPRLLNWLLYKVTDMQLDVEPIFPPAPCIEESVFSSINVLTFWSKLKHCSCVCLFTSGSCIQFQNLPTCQILCWEHAVFIADSVLYLEIKYSASSILFFLLRAIWNPLHFLMKIKFVSLALHRMVSLHVGWADFEFTILLPQTPEGWCTHHTW